MTSAKGIVIPLGLFVGSRCVLAR